MLNGHYWCDHCDEAAGPVCRTCHRDTRFIPAAGAQPVLRPQLPAAAKKPLQPLSQEKGHALFAALLRNLSCL